jgi:hypothetical protein
MLLRERLYLFAGHRQQDAGKQKEKQRTKQLEIAGEKRYNVINISASR